MILTIQYTEVLPDTDDEATRLALQRMTKVHSLLMTRTEIPLSEHIQYLIDLCVLGDTMVRAGDAFELRRELWFPFEEFDLECNCIWAEVVMRGCNLAKRFIADTLSPGCEIKDGTEAVKVCSSIIGILRHIEDVVLPMWRDRAETMTMYTTSSVSWLRSVVRAYGLYRFAQDRVTDPTGLEQAEFSYAAHKLLVAAPDRIVLDSKDGVARDAVRKDAFVNVCKAFDASLMEGKPRTLSAPALVSGKKHVAKVDWVELLKTEHLVCYAKFKDVSQDWGAAIALLRCAQANGRYCEDTLEDLEARNYGSYHEDVPENVDLSGLRAPETTMEKGADPLKAFRMRFKLSSTI
jgi:hypothetical protein